MKGRYQNMREHTFENCPNLTCKTKSKIEALEMVQKEIEEYMENVYECTFDEVVKYQIEHDNDNLSYIVEGIIEANEIIQKMIDSLKDSKIFNRIGENDNISELYKEKVVIEEKPCKRLDIKSDDYPFMNEKDIANIPTTMEKICVKKPIELSDVIDKLNEVIRKVNGE